MTETKKQTLLQSLLDEHKSITDQINDVKHFWSEVDELGRGPKYEEMGAHVRNLREVLAKHFADEERDGYMAPVLKTAPHFVEQTQKLKQQHQQFLDALDHYIDRLEKCESAYHCWQEVRTEFEEFLTQLHEHEAEETRIVQSAAGSEAGSND